MPLTKTTLGKHIDSLTHWYFTYAGPLMFIYVFLVIFTPLLTPLTTAYLASYEGFIMVVIGPPLLFNVFALYGYVIADALQIQYD